MTETEKRVPELRFKGFTDNWEQRKFSNIVNRVSQQANDSNLPKVEFEDIISGEGRLNKDISSKFDSRKGTVFEPEFILYGKLRPYLKNWLFPNFKGIALGDFWVFEPNNSSSIFDYYLIQSDKYQTVANLSSGTKMPRSDWKTVSETVFSIPVNIEEQAKIGTFLKYLDDTIALHQQKLALLKKLKQTFLQVMFPHSGGNIPTLRFDGFSEPWEQRKLIEMANFRRGSFPQPYGEKKWYDDTHGMPFVQVVDVGNNLRLVNNTKQKISKLAQPKSVFVEAGKVLVTLQGSIGRVAITQYPSYVDRTLLIFESYKRPIDEYYFAYVIQQLFEIEKRTAPGGTIKTITKEVLSDFLIHIPEFDEQRTLGNFFKKLDDTIALHQQKIDNIQSLKSTLLNKLFV